MDDALPFGAPPDDEIELSIIDLGVARACWEGVPTARLLARIRLDRDEHDLVDVATRASGLEFASSTWDKLLTRLLADDTATFERVNRAVARHGRAASDEGPLVARDHAIAALVHVLLSAAESDGDSSPAEGAAEGAAVPASVTRGCGRLDERLGAGGADRRAAPFEACLGISAVAVAPALTSVVALRALGAHALSPAALYPWGDQDVPTTDRRALLLDRVAAEASGTLTRELATLVSHHGSLVAFAMLEPRSSREGHPVPPSSWMPSDFGSQDSATRLAGALERGATTAPRVRSVIARGGDAALDAIGAEMLQVAAHPFASAVFADILGRASRERDVVRLVSYFAIAPDLATAAHALGVCRAREVSTVLFAWLESLAPDANADDAKGASRVAACVEALVAYPHLHAAVRHLLAKRVTDRSPRSRP